MDARLKTPFNMIVAAPSQAGKTAWVERMILYQDSLLQDPAAAIVWYSPHEFESPLPNVDVRNCLPWEDENDAVMADGAHRMIVIDDFAQETCRSKELTTLLTKYSHHRNTSVVQITQNLFWAGPEQRTRSLNMHYFVLLRQSRDYRQIATLARQITQNKKQKDTFIAAYNDATREAPYSYLLVSVHPRDPPELLLRSNIFPEEATSATVYLLRGQKV